jgi:hypothetical protein
VLKISARPPYDSVVMRAPAAYWSQEASPPETEASEKRAGANAQAERETVTGHDALVRARLTV